MIRLLSPVYSTASSVLGSSPFTDTPLTHPRLVFATILQLRDLGRVGLKDVSPESGSTIWKFLTQVT